MAVTEDTHSSSVLAIRRRRRSTAVGSAVRVGSVFGVDVSVHASWLLIAVLVTWSIAAGYLPSAMPGIDARSAWALGVVAALLFFASVLAHELAHSLVARASGMHVSSITLFIFGGVSNLAEEPHDASTEFRVSIAGPLTSFLVAAVANVVSVTLSDSREVAAIASYLAFVNTILGGFNLLPGFPLDGGRVLRSIVWRATGNVARATRVATGAGQLVAWGLMLVGFWRLLGGDLLGGFWTVAIGWFLQSAASASLAQTLVAQRLGRLRVRDAVRPDPDGVDPAATIAQLIDGYVLPGARRAVPVVRGGRLLGIVTLSDVRGVRPADRAETIVERVMTPASRLVTVAPLTPLSDALEAMAGPSFEQVPVVEGTQLVGLLTRADIIRELQVREALELAA